MRVLLSVLLVAACLASDAHAQVKLGSLSVSATATAVTFSGSGTGLTGVVKGSGAAGAIGLFNDATTLTSSAMTQSSTAVFIARRLLPDIAGTQQIGQSGGDEFAQIWGTYTVGEQLQGHYLAAKAPYGDITLMSDINGANGLYKFYGVDYQLRAGLPSIIAVQEIGYDSSNNRLMYKTASALREAVTTDDTFLLTDTQKTDLTDAGDSTLHYHAADRPATFDEGVSQGAATTSFDFTGAGITATYSNGRATINVPAGMTFGSPIILTGTSTGDGAAANAARADHQHGHDTYVTGDIHTPYVLANCTRTLAGNLLPDGTGTRSLGGSGAVFSTLWAATLTNGLGGTIDVQGPLVSTTSGGGYKDLGNASGNAWGTVYARDAYKSDTGGAAPFPAGITVTTVTAVTVTGDGTGMTGVRPATFDEGVSQGTNTTSFDFAGAGVTAAYAGGRATVTIPGGGGGGVAGSGTVASAMGWTGATTAGLFPMTSSGTSVQVTGALTADAVAATTTLKLPVSAGTPTVEGQLKNDSTQQALATYAGGLAQWPVGVCYSSTTSTTVTTCTSETTLVGSGNGTVTFPANFWKVGKSLRWTAQGNMVTNTESPSWTFRTYLGANKAVVTSAMTGAMLYNNRSAWVFNGVLTCYAVGAAGRFIGNSVFTLPTGTLATSTYHCTMIAGMGADTTGTLTWDLTCQASTGNANVKVSSTNIILEVLN